MDRIGTGGAKMNYTSQEINDILLLVNQEISENK